MKLPIIMRPLAQAEWDEAIDWYEARSPDLGSDFEAKVRDTLDAIAADPIRYPIAEGDIRVAEVKRFSSYAVYYRVTRGRIVVLSVFHSSRDPAIWHGRA